MRCMRRLGGAGAMRSTKSSCARRHMLRHQTAVELLAISVAQHDAETRLCVCSQTSRISRALHWPLGACQAGIMQTMPVTESASSDCRTSHRPASDVRAMPRLALRDLVARCRCS